MKFQTVLVCALLWCLVAPSMGQFFVRLGDKNKQQGGGLKAQNKPPVAAPAAGEGAPAASVDATQDLAGIWKSFVRWFRENGGIISSKLDLKERNGRQGVFFKERMRRGETVVSFPRTLRMDEKAAFKSKLGHIFRELKQSAVFPDLRVILYVCWEKQNPDSFWKPYLQALPQSHNNIMSLTEAELRKLLRRPGCENTHNLGVQMRRTFNKFFKQYEEVIVPNYPELKFSREELLWGFNTLVTNGWGSGADGTGDKMMVPFSDIPMHRRESAQKATNRGFISAAKEYQAGEELTFDYGLLNDAVLAFYGIPTPDCRGLRR